MFRKIQRWSILVCLLPHWRNYSFWLTFLKTFRKPKIHPPLSLICFVVLLSSTPQQDLCHLPITWQLPSLTFSPCPIVSTPTHSSQIKENNIKTSKTINTTAVSLLLFLVSIVIMHKHPLPKTGENVLPWNPKTSSYSHPNPKVRNLLHRLHMFLSEGLYHK
jgi:hypothetical protein